MPAKTREKRFPKQDWTKYSNGTLQAMMLPGQPPSQRVFACQILNSWGRGKMFVLNSIGKPAGQSDLVDMLDMHRQQVSLACGWLVSNDWLLIDDGGRMFPNPYPEPEAAAEEPAPAALPPGVPTIDEFQDQKDPSLAADTAEAKEKWNDVRTRRRKVESAYEELLEEKLKNGTVDEVTPDLSTVQGQNPGALLTKPVGTVDSILITRTSQTLVSERDAASTQIRQSLTHCFGFVLPETDRIVDEFAGLAEQHGITVEQLGWWMGEKAEAKRQRRKPVTSAGAVRDWAREELGAWAKQNADRLRAAVAAPVEEEPLSLEAEIRLAIELAENPDFEDHCQRKEFLADLARLTREHPAEVAAERELARQHTKAGGAGV